MLDEADRTLHLGFTQELNEILDAMPATFAKQDDALAEKGSNSFTGLRVTTLFSATFPREIQALAQKYLRKPAMVQIGGLGEGVDTVTQVVEMVASEDSKKKRLVEILRSGSFAPPIIVFCAQKTTTEVVVKYVYSSGLSATTLHSDKTQSQREEALQSVRDGDTSVLVATDGQC